MPILENIKAAEEKAEKLRQDAHKEVEDLLVRTRNKAKEQAIKIVADAKKEALKNDQATLDLMNKLEKENLEKIEKEKKALDKLAQQNQEVGVKYILRRVVEIW